MTMLNLAGYQEKNQIYSGTRTLVYRAIRDTDQQSVIIKILRNPHPNFHELVCFRNQYIITRNLEHPAIVQPLSLERYVNGYALVMPDEGALSLLEYWQESNGDLSEFLTIALQLAQALHYLGQQRIIHKDIKPSNILIHPETRQIQLIDFSISSLLPKEQQQLVNPNVLEGTLAYISPEQTGRMNRGIDYRTDFYSLGVTLYELLTGVLPFQNNNPVELLHCHIAKEPLAPDELLDNQGNPYPEAISDIILKLMAKNAEERYQSALGLQHDLEQCLQQWEATGEISLFDLGERDICDRFLIPEKLYGRATEVAQLLEAFEQVATGNSEMMLVAGFSGIGKTAVVNEVHKPIVEKRGYFIKGKFDQFNRNIPFSAFVQAFRDLMGQLLSESDADLAKSKAKILNALGDNAQVIIDVVPELERIIGKQSPAPELSGSAAQNRFNLLFQKFIAVFTIKEHPLVIFLDDLQWADSASLNLMKVLISDSDRGYLLLLGAYRDNEVFPAHPLILSLAELEKEQAALSTITLQPLVFADINQLVAETLICSKQLAKALTDLVYQKTQGNPFFTTQFLQGLHKDQLITFNLEGYWECDLVQVHDAALTDDVVQFMAGRLHKLPEQTQEVLKLAACIGNQFDLVTLALVNEQSQEHIAVALWRALQEGLILPLSETYKFFQGNNENTQESLSDIWVSYKFLHDRVQQAAYSLIPENRKTATHLSIGQLLLAKIPTNQQQEKIFAIVNQLNLGIKQIDAPLQKLKLAQLNLRAGRKAKAAVAYSAALEYFQTGIELLRYDCWQDESVLTLELYNAGAEAAYLNSNYSLMEQWINEIFSYVPNLLARIPAYEVKIQAEIAQNHLQDAIKTGLQVLERLGIQLPLTPSSDDIQQRFAATAAQMEGRSPKDLITLVEMTAPEKLAALKMLAGIWGPAFAVTPPLMPLIVLEMVNLSLEYGNAPISAFAYVLYGVLLCGGENFQGGYEFGKLSLQLLTRFNTQAFKAKILFLIGTHITIWHESVQAALPTLQEAYQAGLETGDLEFAALSAAIYSYYSYLSGKYLSDVKQNFVAYTQAIATLKQTYYLNFLYIWHQAVTNLLQGAENDQYLVGKICNSEKLLVQCEQNNVTTPMAYIYINRLMLNYLFEDYAKAVENSPLADEYAQMVPATLLIPIANFYGSLSKLAFCSQVSESERTSWLDAVRKNQCKMQEWSNCAPTNYWHKYYLVEAEQHRVLGQKLEAMEMYDRAITRAKENEYLQEEALANELAAKFYLDWGNEKIATTYLQEAYYCYARWGAKAKTDQLEEKYPQLLSSILQQQRVEFSPLNSLDSLTQKLTASRQKTSKNSSSTISELLDFTSIFKAAQTLSSRIELEQLLEDIVYIVLTNAGAQKAVLLIPQAEEWQLEAMAQISEDGIVESSKRSQSLTAESSVPIRVIQYVKNTRESVLIDEGKTEISGIIEGYLLEYKPASILCLPLLNQGQLVAIVYLEHPTTKGVFTPERLTIIQFLCAQAAVSLQNAQLYHQAQQAIKDLQRAQMQLAHSEKMTNAPIFKWLKTIKIG